MNDYRLLADGYFEREERYERLAKICAGIIQLRLTEAGIRHSVQSRVKDFASFVRKALTKPDPFHDIGDLAGVRVVVPFFQDRARVAAVVRQFFDVEDEEDTALRHNVDQFGYRGWHFAIGLKASDLVPARELEGHRAELQVHTRAESAWAEAGHDLIYKPRAAVTPAVERRIVRLMALVELFDEQMNTTQEELLAAPGFQEAAMLAALERAFLPLARQNFDRQLSLEVLSVIRPLYTPDELLALDTRLRQLLTENRDFLTELYVRYREDRRRNVLIFQPESLAILDLLERNPIALIAAWDQELPADLLDSLARALGRPLDAYREGLG